MPLDLAKLVKPEIEALLRESRLDDLQKSCSELHAADLQSLIVQLEAQDQVTIIESLESEQRAEVFEYFELEEQRALIDALSKATRKSILNQLAPDNRAELFDELPDKLKEELLAELSVEERDVTLNLLEQEEDTAGRLMTPELISIRATDTVQAAFDAVRKESEHVETIYVVYVVDDDGCLVGTVSLRDLFRAKVDDIVKYVMTTDPISAEVHVDQEELATTMQRYDLIALPIVDKNKRLVGIVTFDDIQDVLEEEASEDILRMHGIAAEADSYFDASIGRKFSQRMIVLAALAVVSFFSVLLQKEFNHVITQVSILAVYLTLLMGSSGNCGTQVAGIIIRAQAIELERGRFARILGREIVVGVLMAMMMAAMAAGLVFIFGAQPETLGEFEIGHLALVVGLAMFGALTTINLLGGIVPVLMKAFGLDPALTAGPFITTTADIVTVLIYFNIAAWMLS